MEKDVIKFYYFDEFLGIFECPQASTVEEREKIAEDNGIDKYTHFIMGDNRMMGVMLNEHKHDLRGEGGKYSTADFCPLPTGQYLLWIQPDGMTVTVKMDK